MNNTEKRPTQAQRKQAQLNRHYVSLHNLLLTCGIERPMQSMRNFSGRLLQIERIAHKAATDYCNGDIDSDMFDRISEIQKENIQKMFGGKLKGLFINGDARGYALKIKDNIMLSEYSETGLHRDWGGYGILAPEIDGN